MSGISGVKRRSVEVVDFFFCRPIKNGVGVDICWFERWGLKKTMSSESLVQNYVQKRYRCFSNVHKSTGGKKVAVGRMMM